MKQSLLLSNNGAESGSNKTGMPFKYGVLVLGALVTGSYAKDNITQLENLPLESTSVRGLNNINYLKIPGYAASGSVVGAYRKNATTQNSSTGIISIRGIPAGGYALTAAVETLKDTLTEIDYEEGRDITDNTPAIEPIFTYEWFRSPGQCTTKTSYELLPAGVNDTIESIDGCPITNSNNATYLLTQDDVYQKVGVSVTVTFDDGDSSVITGGPYHAIMKSDTVCLVDVDYANPIGPDHYRCDDPPLFEDSFEAN